MQPSIGNYVDAALGRRRLTLLIRGARLVNVNTGEVYPSSIGVYKERIVHVGAEDRGLESERSIDAHGAYAIPGLIDTHLHVESSMVTPSRFAEAVLPHGTTTAFADPHEIANVLGKEGVRMMLDNAQGLPMKLFFWAPTCVPESPAVTSGAEIRPSDIQQMLQWPGIAGLGEVMDFEAVLKMTPKMREILETGRRSSSVIDGHSPLLSGRRLGAYMTSGPDSDHEIFTPESMVEKLRMGMYVKLRGPYVLDPRSFLSPLYELPSPWNVVFVTDDVMPDNLYGHGHLDYVCRSFIKAGMDPVEAIRSCTLRPAQHMRMPHLGAISPGKVADILLLDDLKSFRVGTVVSNGRVVAKGGSLVIPSPARPFGRKAFNSMKTGELSPADFQVRPPIEDGSVVVNAIDFTAYRGRRRNFSKAFLDMVLTKLSKVKVKVTEGRMLLGDVAPVFIIDRHWGRGRRAFGFTRNLIRRGAIASSVAHDSHNLIVAGTNQKDMFSAAELVVKAGGGISAFNSRALALVELPVAGLMAEEKVEEVARKMRALRRAFIRMGVLDHPYMPIVCLLTLSVIPHARITDKGIFDVDNQAFVRPYVEIQR